MTQTSFRIWGNNILLLLSLAAMLHCAAADGKTLVLLDNLNIRDTHSIFFRSLAGEYEFITFSCICKYTTYMSPKVKTDRCRAFSVEFHAE